MSHLDDLENESVFILREAFNHFTAKGGEADEGFVFHRNDPKQQPLTRAPA